MSRIRGKDTTPERRVRKILHAMGYRFRLHVKTLPGKPDIVLKKHRAVILVHGCFWHRHQGCRNCTTPTNRREWWMNKFDGNVARDNIHISELRKRGWRPIIIWECETETEAGLKKTQKRLKKFLDSNAMQRNDP